MSPVQPTDLLLVNRAGVDYNVPASQVVADASETVNGIAEIATSAEVTAGTDDQRIVTPLKLTGFQGQFIIQSATAPTLVSHPNLVVGTIWVDISQDPPVLNLYTATGWEELSSVSKQIDPAPGDWTTAPAFVGGTGTQSDPFIITPSTVTTVGGTAQSAQQLSLTGLKVGAIINWTDHSVGAGTRFQQTNGIVPASGNVSFKLAYSDTPNSTASTPYTGDLQLGTTYFRWVVTQQATGVTTPTISSPSAGAVDLGDTPTFTSSAFAGVGTTHASSDWQVTLATDAAFASPVAQSMADATHKVSWAGGPLKANTDYIVRVRHNGTGGVSSAWSAVVAFKTKASFIATLPASDLYLLKGTTATPISAPVKFINAGSCYNAFFGFGVDNKLYKITPDGAVTLGTDFTGHLNAGASIVQGGAGYNASISVIDSKGGLHFFGTKSYVPDATLSKTSIPGAQADFLAVGATACDSAVAVSTTAKKVYFAYPSAENVQLDGISVTIPSPGGWVESPDFGYLFTQHTAPIKQMVTAYTGTQYSDLGNSCVLYSDGVVYSKKQLVSGTYKQIMPIGGSADFWLLTTTGDVVRLTGGTTTISAPILTNMKSCPFGYESVNAAVNAANSWVDTAKTALTGIAAPGASFSAASLNGFGPFVSHSKSGQPAFNVTIVPKFV